MNHLDNVAVGQSTNVGFKAIEEVLRRFNLSSFNSSIEVDKYAELFSLKKLCREIEADRLNGSNSDINRTVSFEEKPYEPEYNDLCRLHYICLSRKVLNVLELGSGFSTAVMADAMRLLREQFGEWAMTNVRVDRPFHVYSVEEEQRFLEITKGRLGQTLSQFATVERSSVDIEMFDSRITTVYSRLPNISPDLIYLDGPSQFATSKEVNGFSFNNRARMPMSSDILRFEFFLEPGTLIVIDGRTANARFLKTYLRRNWVYRHDAQADIHLFELQEEPLGPFNERKIEFCLGGKWLLES